MLTWAPITFVHPFRVAKFMAVNVIATLAWVVSSGVLVAYYPQKVHWAFIVWAVSGLWILVLGLVRTVATKRAQRVSASADVAPEAAADTDR